MKKDTIIQFVCFATNLELDEFVPKWDRYAKKLLNKKPVPTLQQQVAKTKNKFRYVSQHEWPDQDFHFTFMTEKWSEHFPEHNVRVVQAGGYIPLEEKKRQPGEEGDIKLVSFVGHDENDIEYYRQLPLYRKLYIHQAYYESCSFGYVMYFFVSDAEVDELLHILKQRPGVETGIYKECLVAQT